MNTLLLFMKIISTGTIGKSEIYQLKPYIHKPKVKTKHRVRNLKL